MNKLAILIFALAITHTLSATCNAAFATQVGITQTLTALSAAQPTTITSCKSLEGQTACCTTDEINALSTKAGNLIGTIHDLASTRDTAILNARKAVAAKKTQNTAFQAAATAAKTNLDSWATTVPSGETFTTTQVNTIKTWLADQGALFKDFFDNFATYRTGFDTYQTARKACFEALVKAQGSAWCTACKSEAAVEASGVDISANPMTIDYGAALSPRLAAACQPYFVAAKKQGDILRLNYYADKLADMTTALVDIAASKGSGVAAFNTASAPVTANKPLATEIDNACTTTTCAWLNANVFVNGVLKNDIAVLGGATKNTRRVLVDERNLVKSGSFNPDADEVKYTVTVKANPGNVVNTNELSALRVGVFSCIVAFFVALLI